VIFDKPHPKLLPRREFYHRLTRSFVVGAVLILFSLGVGIAGYHWIGELAWIDAFLDASMILSGMGPMSPLHSDAAKLFAGIYAIYCGITLLGTTAIIFAPAVHRALHRFHLEDSTLDS
jgi:polyferredoxin